MSRAERNRRKRIEHPLKYAPIKCPNCGLIVDEKYVVDINSTCPVCGRELFAELKKMIDRQNNMRYNTIKWKILNYESGDCI